MYARIGIGRAGDVTAEIMRHRRRGHRTLYYLHAVEKQEGERYDHRAFGTLPYASLATAIDEAHEIGRSLKFPTINFQAAMEEAVAAATTIQEI